VAEPQPAGAPGGPVRRATAADEADVVRLLAAFRDSFDESEPPDTGIEASVQRLLAEDDVEFLLAGVPPGGIAQVRFRWSVWKGAPDAWLEDVFVEPEARRQGLGRALTIAAVNLARERGSRRIQLDTNERNDAALELYESLGFSARTDRWDGGRDLYLTLSL
jgi:GNAT superfamily N-acetyltransferase